MPEVIGTPPPLEIESLENREINVKESLSANVLASMAARVGYLVTRFFIPPFVLAHVSLEAYGLWSTAFIVVSYIGISTMGLSNVYVKYVAEYSARREFDKANRLLSTGLCVSIPGCLAVFGVLYVFWPHVVEWLHIAPALRTDAREVVLTVVAIFLSSISLSAFHDALAGTQQTALTQVIWVISYLVETALIFILVGMGRGVRGLAEAFLVRTAIDIVLSLALSIHKLKWLRLSPALFSRDSLKILVQFGGVVQILSFFAVALNSIERSLAAFLVGLQATGLLEISEKLPAMASSVPSAFSSSFIPAASYLHGGLSGSPEQKDSIRKLYLKGARYMNLSTAFICALLAAMPAPILDTWTGKHYAGSAYLMVIFAIATQANLTTAPGTSILKGIGLVYAEFWYCLPNVLALAITLPAVRLVEGQWTVIGIGSAVALSTVLSSVVFLRQANRLMGISFAQYWTAVLWPGMVPYLVAAAFAPAGYYAQAHLGRWGTAACVAVTGLAYLAALFWVVRRFVLEAGERMWFEAILRKRLGRM